MYQTVASSDKEMRYLGRPFGRPFGRPMRLEAAGWRLQENEIAEVWR